MPVPWADPAAVQLSKLRVAFFRDNGVAETTPETRDTVAHCAKLLEEEGCQVREDLPKDLIMEMEDIRHRLTNADGWTFVQRMADKWGTKAMSPVLTERIRSNQPVAAAVFTELLESQDDSRPSFCSGSATTMSCFARWQGNPRSPSISATTRCAASPAVATRDCSTAPDGPRREWWRARRPKDCRSESRWWAGNGAKMLCWRSARGWSKKPVGGSRPRCDRVQWITPAPVSHNRPSSADSRRARGTEFERHHLRRCQRVRLHRAGTAGLPETSPLHLRATLIERATEERELPQFRLPLQT